MKALAVQTFTNSDDLQEIETPTPEPAAGEVLIKIAYTGVNPIDWKLCEGVLKSMLEHRFPLIPGWDASGTVVKVGEGVKNLQEGDEVYAYCRKPVVQMGTYAEYITFDASHVVKKPTSLTLAQASSIPLVTLTAWQGLFDRGRVKSGQTLLVLGGSGGVGGMVIQLAKYAGIRVMTTASEKNHAYVKSLGADVAIDYNHSDVLEQIKKHAPDGVDAVFDCVGFHSLTSVIPCIKTEGTIICIVNKPDPNLTDPHHINVLYVFVAPNGEELEKIGALIDEGAVKVPSIQEMPLSQAKKALQLQKTEHVRRKIVLKVEF